MPLMAMMIDLACNNSYPNHVDACSKALEAFAKSSEIYNYDEKSEDYFKLIAKDKADNYLGKDTEDVAGGMYFAYKTYKNKAIDFKLPNFGVCDSLKAHAGQDNGGQGVMGNLGFSWNFPWK